MARILNPEHVFSPKRIPRDVWMGVVKYRYPLCCVVHYCWTNVVRKEMPAQAARRRHGAFDADYVPCPRHVKRAQRKGQSERWL